MNPTEPKTMVLHGRPLTVAEAEAGTARRERLTRPVSRMRPTGHRCSATDGVHPDPGRRCTMTTLQILGTNPSMRRAWHAYHTGHSLEAIAATAFAPEKMRTNIENLVGAVDLGTELGSNPRPGERQRARRMESGLRSRRRGRDHLAGRPWRHGRWAGRPSPHHADVGRSRLHVQVYDLRRRGASGRSRELAARNYRHD